MHALKRGVNHVSYLIGGALFGLLLEYVNVVSNMGYTYGKFMVMFGTAPKDIPLCIGLSWGAIMYTARLFSNSLHLSLWAAAAFDTLLAISIDLSMDAVAYRLHMWHWDWSDTSLDPLTADWFGIPYGNFFGWQMVVFFYSSISRLLERAFDKQQKARTAKAVFTPLIAVILSQVLLYAMLAHVDGYFYQWFGITSKHRFIAFLVVLIGIAGWGISKVKKTQSLVALIAWLVPLWFHLYFFAWLFIGGFYKETKWLIIARVINLLAGVVLHMVGAAKKAVMEQRPAEPVMV